MLNARLKAVGYDVATYNFPRYEAGSSHFVKQYQNGAYGEASQISPYTTSLFYALDRYEASVRIVKDLDAGKIVLAHHFVGANMADQGASFSDPVEQRGFFVWNDNLEYELLKLPRPDINLYLRASADVMKPAEGQTAEDIEHLKKLVATYDLLCRLFPKDFKTIECAKAGKLLSIPDISNLIWEKLGPILPADKPKRGRGAVVTLGQTEPWTKKFPAKDSPDRVTVPFKSASRLLRQKIEMFYPGSTVPRISFWSDNDFSFYTPQDIPKDLKPSYKEIISGLSDKYQRLSDGLKAHYQKDPAVKSLDLRSINYLLEPVTPLAAVIPFEAVLNKSEIMPLARHLLESELSEAQWAAKQLYLMARQVWPADFKSTLETSDPPIGSIIAKFETARLASPSDQPVKLLEAVPRQEFDLLAESLYPFSDLALDEITQTVAEWPYQQKYDNLRQAAGQPSILRKVHYKLDVISDQTTMAALASELHLRHVPVQAVSPRYGFEVPQIIEDANLDDLYNECFDESLRLFSTLQSAGREDLAGYAALAGHKVRWQLNTNAADLYAAREQTDGAGAGMLDKIIEAAAEDHPLLWDVLNTKSQPKTTGPGGQGQGRVKSYHQRHKKTRGTKPKKS